MLCDVIIMYNDVSMVTGITKTITNYREHYGE